MPPGGLTGSADCMLQVRFGGFADNISNSSFILWLIRLSTGTRFRGYFSCATGRNACDPGVSDADMLYLVDTVEALPGSLASTGLPAPTAISLTGPLAREVTFCGGTG